MSQLKTNSIANVAGTASTDVLNVINGSAKAWVNFNGTGTVAIRASYNVSSITDNGVGNHTVNFTTAMPDVNYCCHATTVPGNSASVNLAIGTATAGFLAGSVQVLAENSNGADTDCAIVSVSVFR